MPQEDSAISNRVSFLYTNIGRGHPFYLDGIIDSLRRMAESALEFESSDVFAESNGLSLGAWRAVRRLYRIGSSGGVVGSIYERMRRGADYNQNSLQMRILGRGIRARYMADTTPLIVAHPTLVGLLHERNRLIYQHGECVVPGEALVGGASYVLVPTAEAAAPFMKFGYATDRIVISGLCVEPDLVGGAAGAYEARMQRMASGSVLTGALFSSGAEPKEHVAALLLTAVSLVQNGGRVIVFARHQGRLDKVFLSSGDKFSGFSVARCDVGQTSVPEIEACTIVRYRTRAELDLLTCRYFPEIDYLVAPSHERTNWALGLGMPMFALAPAIGSYAPLNLELLKTSGVAFELPDLQSCVRSGNTLAQAQSDGTLAAMAGRGWGRHPISGFAAIADFLSRKYGSRQAGCD